MPDATRAMLSRMGVFGYDLTDAALFESGFPHRIFSGIRRDCPVAWHAPARFGPVTDGFWSVAAYAEVTEVLDRCMVHAPAPAALEALVDDAVGATVLEFARRPDLWVPLLEAGSIGPAAVDELARWVSPTSALVCQTTDELRLGRHRIDAGQRVVCWIASANRDESVFGRDSMDLRLDRSPNPHLAFVADPGARGRFADRLTELVEQRSTFQLDGEPEWVRDTVRTALSTLPLRLMPWP